MSSVATDSDDNSIDWLASSENDDNEEDEEGEDQEEEERHLRQRPDCTDRHTSTTTTEEDQEGSSASPLPMCPLPGPPSPPGGVWLLRQHGNTGRDNVRDMDKVATASSRRCCTGTTHAQDDQDQDQDVVCINNTQQQHQANAERSNGRRNGVNSQHALRKRSHSPTPAKDHRGPAEMSEKDQVFTRKCMELQCYIQPLSLILTGLRSGRYRERLSSFQESVAMDRIQRIMGVLQNPCMGEKYVNIILKMEEMLKSWFPNVKQPRDQHHANTTPTQSPEDITPSKRLKLSSAVTTALSSSGGGGAASPHVQQHQQQQASNPAAAVASKTFSKKPLRVTDTLTPPGAYFSSAASTLKWLHTSPLCCPAGGAGEQQGQGGGSLGVLLPPSAPLLALGTPQTLITQDSSVSSTTTDHSSGGGTSPRGGVGGSPAHKTDSSPQAPPPASCPSPRAPPAPRLPPPGKINAPCLERLLKSTESIITARSKQAAGLEPTDSTHHHSWS